MGIKSFAKKIIPHKLWETLAKKYRKTKSIPFYLLRVFPIVNNKIVVSNFVGNGFGDNPKYIVLELLKHHENYDIVWLVKNLKDKSFPPEVRLVKIDSWKSVYEQVTARIWIDNCRKRFWVRKRKSQYYIQTWHGSLGPKKCEKDAEVELGLEYVKMAKNDSSIIDLCVSNGTHISNFYKNSFWYSGDVFECGTPRNDILLNIDDVQKKRIKEILDIKGNICLYAPTFRNDYATKYYDLNYDKLRKTLKTKFKNDFSILVRLHPNLASMKILWKLQDGVINVTDYPDMQELLAVSDVVITDYSSCIYDFGFTKRPAFIFALDVDEYKRTNRDLYFELANTPFKLAQTNDELMENIEGYSEDEYKATLEKFYEFHGVFENGDASQKVANIIKDNICGVKK